MDQSAQLFGLVLELRVVALELPSLVASTTFFPWNGVQVPFFSELRSAAIEVTSGILSTFIEPQPRRFTR